MRVLQLNLNHCEAAQDLLSQTVLELNVDVAVLSEPYKPKASNWLQDTSGKSAIWCCKNQTNTMTYEIRESGFICAKVNDRYIYSVYIPPSAPIDTYTQTVLKMVIDAESRNKFFIAGDFNAWAQEWGCPRTSPRGKILLESIACLDVALLNTGTQHTFSRNGYGSIIDLTFASSGIARLCQWGIKDVYTHSDHAAIICDIKTSNKHSVPTRQLSGWKINTLDTEVFKIMLQNASCSGSANNMAKCVMKSITAACDASMKRKTAYKSQSAVYWWNERISMLRKECLKARRKFQRSRGRVNFLQSMVNFKAARKAFKNAIKESKRNSFLELCDDAERNPWGSAYRIVAKKLKSSKSAAPMCPSFMAKIVDTLFPKHKRLVSPINNTKLTNFDFITEDEIIRAASSLADSKAPGPDGVPNKCLKLAIEQQMKVFSSLFNSCLSEGTFPSIWKRQNLILLPKPGKSAEEPSSYRPICLTDSAGKVLERILSDRLDAEVRSKGGLSENQFGFRKGKSTIDAVSSAIQLATKAISGTRWLNGTKEYCLIITLDVRNAFNSANWAKILDALERIGVSMYLRRILRSYFDGRILRYSTSKGQKKVKITSGVPQGSVLGPLLWNIMYDGVLRVRIPERTKIIGFADDIAVVVTAKNLGDIRNNAIQAVFSVQSWLAQNKLDLAQQKTEAILISSRKKPEEISFRIGDFNIMTTPAIKYLGIMIDKRLSFKAHFEYANKKASTTTTALSRLMLNVRGPKQNRRQLLANVVKSQILYGAPIWANKTDHVSYFRGLQSTYRLCALRVCSAFKTVSDDAALVISGMYPLGILARETAQIARAQRPISPSTRAALRDKCIDEWQTRWDNSGKGRWMHRCIPNLKLWLKRPHGEVDFYLTQFLSGHGCFKAYLYRFNHDDNPYCDYCDGNMLEDAHHIFFTCSRFRSAKERLYRTFGELPSPETFVHHMLRSKEQWNAACDLVAEIMKEMRRLERLRHSNGD